MKKFLPSGLSPVIGLHFKKMIMPKLVVMLRVKDGMTFIHEWLSCYEKLADEIVALDNGSTDGTYEVLKAHPKVVDLVCTEGCQDGRDKDIVYAMLKRRKAE